MRIVVLVCTKRRGIKRGMAKSFQSVPRVVPVNTCGFANLYWTFGWERQDDRIILMRLSNLVLFAWCHRSRKPTVQTLPDSAHFVVNETAANCGQSNELRRQRYRMWSSQVNRLVLNIICFLCVA